MELVSYFMRESLKKQDQSRFQYHSKVLSRRLKTILLQDLEELKIARVLGHTTFFVFEGEYGGVHVILSDWQGRRHTQETFMPEIRVTSWWWGPLSPLIARLKCAVYGTDQVCQRMRYEALSTIAQLEAHQRSLDGSPLPPGLHSRLELHLKSSVKP